MKKLLIIISAVISQTIFSQVIIGDTTGSASNKTSVLLEFPNGQNKGIILPYTRTLPSSPTEGTLLLDAATNTSSRIKYYNGSWIDLSGQDADLTSVLSDQPTNAQILEESNAKVIIGSNNSTASGVLVLESQTKALLLPSAESTDEIPNPSPGMIIFIRKNGAKRLAVFNGNKWSYWMAGN
ncbi:hypothetical protein C1637_20810 [Chryseobacterium lactis]|uniref:Uncharacterized protein n=1 Tax=Chryseobacterium lactis TaxID=1241981 RepID=A0A3G6RD81_CHRLC|nr:hypothetical protein [Chryseobacterium lactis]AZA82621.1 hypothetical protein EG342_12345 [Chryseobacterium lactis]AZB03002.1 hypothetical protein EG341_03205 [Chryseobacterium lactis]PNW11857.1 hypothetical protein C1637_20810 [Chryseobacterium lactis]